MKLLNNTTKAFTETWLGLGLFLGFFLVLTLYLTVSPQLGPENFVQTPPANGADQDILPIQEKNETREASPASNGDEKNNTTELSSGREIESPVEPLKPICDFSDWRYDGCEMYGDARAMGNPNNSVVFFIPLASQIGTAEANEWKVRSQSRKIVGVKEVIVKSLNSSSPEAPQCSVTHSVPAVVFALGGLNFNYWHSFSDILVPLFTTSRAFDGEVQFLITGYQLWFVEKFKNIFNALSKFEIIDFDNDKEVRCYPHIIIGLRGHGDLSIDPKRAPRNYDMFMFRMFLRDAYSLPLWADIPYKMNNIPDKKPRLMIILRAGSRKFVNGEEIVQAIERSGFEVVKAEPKFVENITAFSKLVDSCDVLMGAHGAGLTNILFLRTNAIMLQVVPYGRMEWACQQFLGGPAREMKIRDVEYNITAKESTLYEKYGKDDPVIADPELIYKEGKSGFIYWAEQQIRLNVTRFTPFLEGVIELLKQ